MAESTEISQNGVSAKEKSSLVASGHAKAKVVPGSEKMVSIADRSVEPGESSDHIDPVAADASDAMSTGWTARRPTVELQR
jgi:hypothetical protein